MVITVTLNPCVDRTLEISGLVPGGTNKVLSSRTDLSGKGVNVSLALRELGEETLCAGLNYIDATPSLAEFLGQKGIPTLLVDTPGPLRVNHKIFDRCSRTMTEYNESGTGISAETLAKFIAAFEALLRRMSKKDLLVLDGSVPPGTPDNFYQELILRAKKSGVRTVLDASGGLLKKGLEAAPYAIKPNRAEFEALVGRPLGTVQAVFLAAKEFVNRGIPLVCISLGGDGALLAAKEGCWYAPAVRGIAVRGLQGAGDSFVAGLCKGLLHQLPAPELLRCCMAAAAGSILREGTQVCTRTDYAVLSPRVVVHPMNGSQ